MNDLPINVDTKLWAQQVREIKIRELKELIESTNDATRIPELEKKLNILETK